MHVWEMHVRGGRQLHQLDHQQSIPVLNASRHANPILDVWDTWWLTTDEICSFVSITGNGDGPPLVSWQVVSCFPETSTFYDAIIFDLPAPCKMCQPFDLKKKIFLEFQNVCFLKAALKNRFKTCSFGTIFLMTSKVCRWHWSSTSDYYTNVFKAGAQVKASKSGKQANKA